MRVFVGFIVVPPAVFTCRTGVRHTKLILERGTVRQHDNDGDGWREYDDSVPVVATTLELLAEHGLLGPVWWRFGRPGRHSLIEALDNPDHRAAYDQRQAAREKKARQAHRELMRTPWPVPTVASVRGGRGGRLAGLDLGPGTRTPAVDWPTNPVAGQRSFRQAARYDDPSKGQWRVGRPPACARA
ncbi:hypothetical protein [Kitasatospora sp. NPDC056531]|uniref:hypothetical protein n=1 Tax=Kitasatospora sp. NPDC056531 TaxID=3345856 RepID=UPI0036B63346